MDERSEMVRWLRTTCPADLRDAAVAGFELTRVVEAAREGHTKFPTDIDEIRAKRRDTMLRLKLHPDQGSAPKVLASTVNAAATRMIERRKKKPQS